MTHRQSQMTPGASRDVLQQDLEVFIVAHEAAIIEQAESQGRFGCLPRYRYVLVGTGHREPGPADRVVVAERLPDDIEKHRHLLSFTAWYAVAKNALAQTAYVAFLEYDVDIAPEFHQRTLECLMERRRIVGYVPWPLTHARYMYATHWFPDALSEVYRLDAETLVDRYLQAGGPDLWTATTNLSMPTEDLGDFVDWFLPLSRIFRHDPIGGHVLERMIPIYCMLNKMEIYHLPSILTHHQMGSHGTQTRRLAEVEEIARARGRAGYTTPDAT